METDSVEGVASPSWEDGYRIRVEQRIAKAQESLRKNPACIFRLPQKFIETIGQWYQPQLVSIGPYYNGKPHLQLMEEYKWECLGSILNRTTQDIIPYYESISLLEQKARECYSEEISLTTADLVERMVLDGCFILELLAKIDNLTLLQTEDSLGMLSTRTKLAQIRRDLLLLENQIPFFVLEKLFDVSNTTPVDSGQTLFSLVETFFSKEVGNFTYQSSNQRPEPLHLLDVVRTTYIPPDEGKSAILDSKRRRVLWKSNIIPCVSKLRRAGIKVNEAKGSNFSMVRFKDGAIEMPRLQINTFICSFLVNCVAFEQCYHSFYKHFSVYASFLDCLVNSAMDVEYLCDRNVVDNYFATDDEAARFINNLGRDLSFDNRQFYLGMLFSEIDEYYRNRYHVQWASFKQRYFKTPWSFISAVAAFVLLAFTFLQTFYTIYGYVHPKA
ncbi:hypothetical protein CJ030_MR2G002018 [Morella rubra]|uniref:Uncharacterized protein n=1 Tax=Morella rubra TaxID=262757 RepID=A0A6A1WBP7_9ROSI|nr:hypothetical protein CJ030_MR2G002018 [Morella rubra]